MTNLDGTRSTLSSEMQANVPAVAPVQWLDADERRLREEDLRHAQLSHQQDMRNREAYRPRKA